MDGGGLYCPVEECEENRGGYCNIRQDGPLGWASMAFFVPGQTNLAAPIGPSLGMLRSDIMSRASRRRRRNGGCGATARGSG